MNTLNTKQIYAVPPPVQISPAVPVQFVKPVSYDFRVAEHLNVDGVIEKVGLQVQVYEHDEYGIGVLKQYWSDVERVKIPYVAVVG
jgi:hypothetical protein